MATGWDFPDDECRWQIIIKLPYPDTRGKIMSARSRSDSDFTSYITMQQLIQATGRGVRNKRDWCETFILDNNITWFLKSYKHLSVEWFKGAFMVKVTIPQPLSPPNKGE
jgi:Rad3-related DNA helicase